MSFTGPLEDRIAIRELCDQYCDGVMRKDMTIWGATWAPDAEWQVRGTTIRGRADILTEATKIVDSFSSGLFFCNPGSAHIDGDSAKGRCYHVELFFFADGPAWFLTFYDDDYLKREGRWYFQKRYLTVMQEGKL